MTCPLLGSLLSGVVVSIKRKELVIVNTYNYYYLYLCLNYLLRKVLCFNASVCNTYEAFGGKWASFAFHVLDVVDKRRAKDGESDQHQTQGEKLTC